MENKIHMALSLWLELLAVLEFEGNQERETGAFLLGPKRSPNITEYKLYTELDPDAFHERHIEFKQNGYVSLWDYCIENNLKVWADIHTHPGKWIEQSLIDKNHPMIAQKGHIALIVPHFGAVHDPLNELGIYQYQGNYKWKSTPNLFTIKQNDD